MPKAGLVGHDRTASSPLLRPDGGVDGVMLPGSLYGTLSQILRFVARDDYTWWMAGEIPIPRVLDVAARLNSKHQVFMEPHARSERRAAGLPVAQVVFAPRPVRAMEKIVLPFVLLATEPLPAERLKRVASDDGRGGQAPIVWRRRYVLRRRPTGHWTWHMTEEAFAAFAKRIAAAADGNDARRLHAVLAELTKLPLFHGVSKDAAALIKLAASRWAHRTRRSAGPKPPSLDVNAYLRRVRPRRGVGGRVYASEAVDRPVTLRELYDAYAPQLPAATSTGRRLE